MNLFTLSLLLLILLQYIAQAQVINCDDDFECKDQILTGSTFICSGEDSCFDATLNCVENRNCTVSCSGMWTCALGTINAPINGSLYLDCGSLYGDQWGTCELSDVNCKNGECIITCGGGEDTCRSMTVNSQPDTTKIDIITSDDSRVLNTAKIHCPSSSIGGANEDNCNIVIHSPDARAIGGLEIFAVESFNDFNLTCIYQTSPIPECYGSDSKPTVHCGSNLNHECQMELKPGSNHEWQCVNVDNICNDYIATAPPTTSASTFETTTTIATEPTTIPTEATTTTESTTETTSETTTTIATETTTTTSETTTTEPATTTSTMPATTSMERNCDCNGGIVELTVQYIGECVANVTAYYDIKKHLDEILPNCVFYNVDPYTHISCTAPVNDGQFKKKLYFDIVCADERRRLKNKKSKANKQSKQKSKESSQFSSSEEKKEKHCTAKIDTSCNTNIIGEKSKWCDDLKIISYVSGDGAICDETVNNAHSVINDERTDSDNQLKGKKYPNNSATTMNIFVIIMLLIVLLVIVSYCIYIILQKKMKSNNNNDKIMQETHKINTVDDMDGNSNENETCNAI